MLDFYNKTETKELMKSKNKLYYVDNGVDEVVARLEDIADIIFILNQDLKIIDFDTLNVVATTYSMFLNHCDVDFREKIIGRLVKLQTGEEIEKDNIKVINEELLDEV